MPTSTNRWATARHAVGIFSPQREALKVDGHGYSPTILHRVLHMVAVAAARVLSNNEASAERKYDSWTAKIWEGHVDIVIDELTAYGRKFGEPSVDAGSDDPREVIRRSRVYYENHACRMDYPSYRCAGFPLTSSLMESMVKQVSRRVKGPEKYWSSPGGEAILRLCGEYLSDDESMRTYWEQRSRHTSGAREYRPKDGIVHN